MDLQVGSWPYSEGAKRSDAGRMSGRFCGFRLPLAGFCCQTCQRRLLPRAFESACDLLGPEDVTWQKICLSADFRSILPGSPSSCWRNSGLWRIGRHIRRTWTYWTLLSDVFCRREARLHLTQIHLNALRPSIAAEWDWLVAKYFYKNCCLEASIMKMVSSLNSWTGTIPTRTNQYSF